LAAGCLLAALSCAVPLFADPTYTTFYVSDNQGSQNTSPTGINLSGTIIGTYSENYIGRTTATYGFVRDPSGTITTFDLGSGGSQAGPYTAPMAINNAGTIVGELRYNGMPHGFMLDSKGTITTFNPPNFPLSGATGINAEGAIVGYYYGSGNNTGSYVRNPDGTFHLFEVKGAGQTWAVGINMAYLVTGYYTDANRNYHGFVGWPNSYLLTTFDVPGSVSTRPTSINSFGAITGWYTDAANVYHGFIRNPLGNIVSFEPVGSQYIYPTDINDAGAIVGSYGDSNNVWHNFLRDPGGTITAIDPPGYTAPIGGHTVCINDHGVITGLSGGTGFVRTP
jgi:hypothetical protein